MCNAQQAANLTASFRSQPILNPIIRATRVNYRFGAGHAVTDRYGEQIPSDGSWPVEVDPDVANVCKGRRSACHRNLANDRRSARAAIEGLLVEGPQKLVLPPLDQFRKENLA